MPTSIPDSAGTLLPSGEIEIASVRYFNAERRSARLDGDAACGPNGFRPDHAEADASDTSGELSIQAWKNR
jgi:hypothetical protein